MTSAPNEPCPGCGAHFPPRDGPVHEYMESCWHADGIVLAREYQSAALLPIHRLSVDTYAVQHPGGDSRQAIQSVGVHLARLCLFLERGLTAEAANAAMLRVGKTKGGMFKLARPASLGTITVADVLAAEGETAHADAVRRWARCAWDAWEAHHGTVRKWVDAA